PVKFSVGYANGSDQSSIDAGVATKGGTPLDPTQTIARAVLTGDANMDGKVNFFDISQVLGYRYNGGGTTATYTQGDLNYDGKVNFFDLSLVLSANYNSGQVYKGAPSAAAAASTGLPTLVGSSSAATVMGSVGDGKI